MSERDLEGIKIGVKKKGRDPRPKDENNREKRDNRGKPPINAGQNREGVCFQDTSFRTGGPSGFGCRKGHEKPVNRTRLKKGRSKGEGR